MKRSGSPRVIALVAAYNERRFILHCLDQLEQHGVEAYLIDNCSTDSTVGLAESRLSRNLIGIESFPRGTGNAYDWRGLLRRKEQLARELDADWFMHLDPDEVRLPPAGEGSLSRALAAVDREGFNAVNFAEFTFIPTQENPDHDHADFPRTLRTYYPFAPQAMHQVKAWKATPELELASSGGHRVGFPGMRICAQAFPMKHYLFLSVPHAIEKYVERQYDPGEVASGWHGWRASLSATEVRLPHESELQVASPGEPLSPRKPRTTHYLDERA